VRVLLIEDDENKRRQILSFIGEEFPSFDVSVTRSYTSGLKSVRDLNPDLVLLDMSLPNFDGELNSNDGGKFRSYGGRDILHQMSRRQLTAKVIVVTQYDTFSSDTNAKTLETLMDELMTEFPENFLSAVFYNASQDEWKINLRELLSEISQ
jgi:DNA-binding NarL/FixJ family response regulator